MSDFLMTTYLSCIWDGCFKKRLILIFQWVRFVLRYSPICFYTLMRQISFKGLSRIKIENQLTFNSSFRYIDDVLSLNNVRFDDYLHSIKDTTDTQKSASYLDFDLEIDNGERLKTKLYDKRDDLIFPTVNFLFTSSNIPASPTYGIYISQLIVIATKIIRSSSQSGGVL